MGLPARPARCGRTPPFGCEPDGGGGGGIPGGLLGIVTSVAAPARATGAGGASAPPFTGRTAGPGRAGVGCPRGGTGEGTGIRTGAEGPAAALLITAGATGTGRSSGCSTERPGLGATGVVAGPAAGGGTTGFGGGGGETTALRAVAFMSAIERVSGWRSRSDLKSCSFLRSSPAGTCGASTGAAGGTGSAVASPTFSAAGSPSARKCARTLSARSSSSALE
jgi:hypothetical protein